MDLVKHVGFLVDFHHGFYCHVIYIDYMGNFLQSFDYTVDQQQEFADKVNDIKKYHQPVLQSKILGRYVVFFML